jgi:hypothetical protein
MPDIEDYNDEAVPIDLVKSAPLPGEASTVDTAELFAERSTHALEIRQQRPCDELNGCDRHVMRQQFGERAMSRMVRTQLQLNRLLMPC